ncbi:hypothetical protein cypCar_00038490, partial [Cyprinus carpio]
LHVSPTGITGRAEHKRHTGEQRNPSAREISPHHPLVMSHVAVENVHGLDQQVSGVRAVYRRCVKMEELRMMAERLFVSRCVRGARRGFRCNLAVLDLNSADVQGVPGRRYIPPHLRNKEASKNVGLITF